MNPPRALTPAAELRRQLTRRRTMWYLVLVLGLPVVLWLAFTFGSPSSGGTRLVDLARVGAANFTIFTVSASADFLLLIVAAGLGGDPVPSEASWGSLRYLLTAPVSRARLLTSKLIVAVFSLVVLVIALVGWSMLLGGLAYGWSPFSTTSGVGMDWSEFLPRLAIITGFIIVNLLQVLGLAFFIGTRTDAPLAAVGGAVVAMIVCQIIGAVEALGDLRDALPMHFSRAWSQLLFPEVAWAQLQRGALWAIFYFLLTTALAFWSFRRKDVLS